MTTNVQYSMEILSFQANIQGKQGGVLLEEEMEKILIKTLGK